MLKFEPIGLLIFIVSLIFSIVIAIRQKKTFLELFCFNVFVVYILAVISITLFPMPVFESSLKYLRETMQHTNNFVPFKSMYQIFSIKELHIIIRQLGGNLCMLAPLGIYLPLTFNKIKSFKHTLLIGIAIAVGIELIQLSIGAIARYNYRSFDVDDIILNVLGVCIGYLVYLIIRPIYNKLLQMSLEKAVSEVSN